MQESKCKTTSQNPKRWITAKRWQEPAFLARGMTLWVVVMLVVGLGGCAPTGVKGVHAFEDLPAAEGEVASDAEFLFKLSEKKHCTTDDAYRGMLYFIDGKDTSGNFQERTARLAMRGVVDKNWTHKSNAAITNGRVAYMLARVLGVRGGVMYNLTNASGRYALRELVSNGIIKGQSEYSKVSGAEYVGILGRADDYRQEKGDCKSCTENEGDSVKQ